MNSAKSFDLVSISLGLRTVIFVPAQSIIFTSAWKFIQVRKFGGMRSLFGNFFAAWKSEEGLSSFQALTTAIAAQVGTVILPEPRYHSVHPVDGSFFWMWVSGVFHYGYDLC